MSVLLSSLDVRTEEGAPVLRSIGNILTGAVLLSDI